MSVANILVFTKYRIYYLTGNYSYINIDSESITLGLTRGNMNIFFTIFIAIIVAESFIFIPYYLEKKKADAPGIPLGCVGILFALPNIRNTMPGAPPLGWGSL